MTEILLVLLAIMTQAPAASLEGRVLRSGTNEPVVRAGVVLTKVGGRLSDSVSATTDAQGRFSFSSIPAGDYRLFAEHADYVRGEYGQRSIGRPGSAITLAAGQRLGEVTLTLTPSGVISGRAVNGSGDPVHAQIQALKRSYAQGRARVTVIAEVSTNDLGEYRLFGLPPGDYVVGATPYGYQRIYSGEQFTLMPPLLDVIVSISNSNRGVSAITESGGFIEPAALRGENYGARYFPGVADVAAARRITVEPGAVVSGTDFQILPALRPPAPLVKVRGQVVDTTGQLTANATVQLGDPEDGFTVGSLHRSVRITPDARGAFEFDRIDPGRYIVHSTSATGSGTVLVDVGNSDLEGLRLVLNPRVDVNGRIAVEGQATVDLTKVIVWLRAPAFSRQGTVRADGSFSMQGVIGGDYRLEVEGTPATLYLKSARLGSDDVLVKEFSLKPPPQTLELVLSANTGTLEGTVSGADRRPAAGVRVVVVPEASRRASFERYRVTSTDSAGRFRAEGIAPGEYKVFAWEDIEENAWQVPEILRRYEEQGKAIRILELARESLDLQMIPK
jgi:hypothetical protein